MRRFFAIGWFVAAVTACSSTATVEPPPVDTADAGATVSDDTGTATEPSDGGLAYYTWWQDVEPIVSVKCQLCHQDPPQFTAPRPLVAYEHTQVLTRDGVAVFAEMARRIVAPRSRMPPPSQPQLTQEEVDIIRTWAEIGAPEGTPPAQDPDAGQPADAGPAPDDTGVANDDASVTEDASANTDSGVQPPADAGMMMTADSGVTPGPGRSLELRATAPGSNAPYELPTADTNYRCWSLTIPAGGGMNENAIRFEHIVDNSRHLHHMLLFKNRNRDAADGPFRCGDFSLNWDMISGWAPGRLADTMPQGVGVSLEEGDQLVLQVHYDDVRNTGQTDNSGIRIITVDQAGLTEAGIMWAGGAWLSPLNGSNVQRRGTCRIRQPVTIFANFPHMHELGLRITLELKRAGTNSWEPLTEVPAWDFEDQPRIDIPAAGQNLDVGDELRTTCWWDTQGRSVNFGEATDDEMCFNFIYHYPLVSNPTLACATILR